MRVGFDLDGVLADVSVAEWLLTGQLENKEMQDIITSFLHDPKLRMHPSELLHEEDDYIIITGRGERYRKITERWLRKYGISPTCLFLTNVGVAQDYPSVDDFFDALALAKAQYIRSECIDIFFEDSPDVVLRLRKLCPKARIVQVGGRLK